MADERPSIDRIRPPRPTPYRDALRMQQRRREQVEQGGAAEAIFLLEHAPVLTLGRNASEANLLRDRPGLATLGIDVVDVERGGDVTYHGPGQLVAYPIIHLERRGLGIRQYLRLLEQSVIDTLEVFGLKGERLEGFTGVWVDGAKVAAIGIAVHRGVAFHGIAINVDPNMQHWSLIVPCGIPDKPVTSLAALFDAPPSIDRVEEEWLGAFEHLLGTTAGHRVQ